MAGFYLGKGFDLANNKLLDAQVNYDPSDLTTHGMVVGMTGSGKTGLCIDLLEEAALAGIPAIMVDPKGDLTNLLLHFPDLAPTDFLPWLDAEQARRTGKPIEAVAADTAQRWKSGLESWGIGQDRIQKLKEAAEFAIYTPGSDAGYPVSILATLKAPAIPWESNKEALREKISSTVTALLGLVGYKDVDPVRSREHILLSNIFESAWSQSKDLDLTELILQTQNPPFDKLGVFPIDKFFPENDRFQLAMMLNNFLAAPAFQAWIEGQPLDIGSLLFTPQGKPRHCVFYLAHLEETERMFFVTLLFSAIESWMRTQPGSPTLRALVYFDEIAGYLPPVSNPPSKTVMMRLLKQARAFGVGLLLASQNPVDIDYKALSNTGTWLIGKLQTDQDKQRLLDGLVSAVGGLDRAEIDRLISALTSRVFLLNNVHQGKPVVMQSRWSMNYLAGPLTRAQIPALNQLVSPGGPSVAAAPIPAAQAAVPAPAPVSGFAAAAAPVASAQAQTPAAQAPTQGVGGSITRPPVPTGVDEFFFPNNLTLSEALQAAGKTISSQAHSLGLVYHPVLVGQAQVRYLDRRYGLDYNQRRTVRVSNPDRRGAVRWDDFAVQPVDPQAMDRNAAPEARFTDLEGPLADAKMMAGIQKDFQDWVYRTSQIKVKASDALKIYAGPDTTPDAFKQQCTQAVSSAAEAEKQKAAAGFDGKLAALQDKISREQRDVDKYNEQLNLRRADELGSAAETIFGLFTGSKRKVTTPINKHRMAEQAKDQKESSQADLAELQKDAQALAQAKAAALKEIEDRWAKTAADVHEIAITPTKTNVYAEMFGVAWLPYYVVQDGANQMEVAGFA